MSSLEPHIYSSMFSCEEKREMTLASLHGRVAIISDWSVSIENYLMSFLYHDASADNSDAMCRWKVSLYFRKHRYLIVGNARSNKRNTWKYTSLHIFSVLSDLQIIIKAIAINLINSYLLLINMEVYILISILFFFKKI